MAKQYILSYEMSNTKSNEGKNEIIIATNEKLSKFLNDYYYEKLHYSILLG
jgi:hypothetical protein